MDTYHNGSLFSSLHAQGKTVNLAYKGGDLIYKKKNPYTLTNIVTNGSFESAISTNGLGYSVSASRKTHAEKPMASHGESGGYLGEIPYYSSAARLYLPGAGVSTNPGFTKNNIYYMRAQVATTNAATNTVFFGGNPTTWPAGSSGNYGLMGGDWKIAISAINKWHLIDIMFKPSADLTASTGGSIWTITAQTGASGRYLYVDNYMCLNLTSGFGSGKEPTLQEIRQIVSRNAGYWDGDKTIYW